MRYENHRKVSFVWFGNQRRCAWTTFYREDAVHYGRKLVQVVNQVLERDLPMVEDIAPDTIRKVRRMLTILAASTPQTPNITELSRNLGMDRKQGIKILYLLQRAGLTGLLAEDADALKYLGAPSKIFCDNGNLMQALVARPDSGTMREAFFNNQLGVRHVTTYPKKGTSLLTGGISSRSAAPRRRLRRSRTSLTAISRSTAWRSAAATRSRSGSSGSSTDAPHT